MKRSVKLGCLIASFVLGVSGVNAKGVVKYKGKDLVTSTDVDAKLKELKLTDAPRDQVFMPVLLQLAEERLVKQKIKDSKMESDQEFQKAAAANADEFKRNYYFQKEALKRITPQMRQSVYAQMQAALKGKKEVHPKIIVLTDEKKACEVHTKLVSGKATFDALARDHSIDPSKADGGKLGRFLPEEAFSPEVTKVLAELKEGVPSKPIKSASPSGDVHIIVQVDKGMRRDRTLPPIDAPEMKHEIDQIIARQMVRVVQAGLLQEIEVYDEKGNKLPLSQDKQAPAPEGIPLIGGGMKTN